MWVLSSKLCMFAMRCVTVSQTEIATLTLWYSRLLGQGFLHNIFELIKNVTFLKIFPFKFNDASLMKNGVLGCLVAMVIVVHKVGGLSSWGRRKMKNGGADEYEN